MKSLLIIILMFSNSVFSQEKPTEIKQTLIGFWHFIPHVPSGWGETYSFHSNGTYVYKTSSMLCGRRLLSINGEWNHTKGILILTQKQKKHRINGKFEKAFGSCGDEFELVNSKTTNTKISPNIVMKIKLDKIEHDKKAYGINQNKITINNQSYWKFSNDPNHRK